jgi:hypothetical protein
MMNETMTQISATATAPSGAMAAGAASMRYREMTSPLPGKSFWGDTIAYAQRVKYFDRTDWMVYIAWVGLMAGLVFSTFGFVLFGWMNGVNFPAYVWNLPLGTAIFVGAIAFDTIGHRTAYKDELKKGEALVHGITIFAGITSCFLLTLCFHFPVFLRIPTAVFIIMSVFYSVIDEALHWRRYFSLYSDRVEMWSHFFIFLGHFIFVWAWWHWYDQGYQGVAETVAAMGW